MKPLHPFVEAILRFFDYDHLPPHLQEISAQFHSLAWDMACRLEGDELIAGLRKLLEAKDCMVRAALPAFAPDVNPEEKTAVSDTDPFDSHPAGAPAPDSSATPDSVPSPTPAAEPTPAPATAAEPVAETPEPAPAAADVAPEPDPQPAPADTWTEPDPTPAADPAGPTDPPAAPDPAPTQETS